jgi:hypothetical protein
VCKAYNTNEINENRTENFSEKDLNEGRNLGNLVVNGKIILTYI